MEELRKNYNKILEIYKENKKIDEKIKDIKSNLTFNLFDTNKEAYIKKDDEIKALKNKMQLNEIKIAILKNNLHYLLKIHFEGIKNIIIDYYNNKKIGDKTKEKMQNIIKEYYNNNFNINISCYISFISNYSGLSGIEISIDFLNKEGFKSFVLEYNEGFSIKFNKHKYNNYELEITYNRNIDNYIDLVNLNKEAKRILKDYNKTLEKIEDLRIKQKELYHNFNDYLSGFLYEKLALKNNIDIY